MQPYTGEVYELRECLIPLGREVASLEPDQQEHWLGEAETHGWSVTGGMAGFGTVERRT